MQSTFLLKQLPDDKQPTYDGRKLDPLRNVTVQEEEALQHISHIVYKIPYDANKPDLTLKKESHATATV